ncbi:unnamed protein product [Pseudo-nitzschia multistriata]|uniref:Uncharacterized protein n=1 Tax=Pseudo-nitzschia multistriata TaxID=183589 RepID=A0A448YYI6_9STRA|nr:unnamed protein product [Pseudo-nitzschia multistriata]
MDQHEHRSVSPQNAGAERERLGGGPTATSDDADPVRQSHSIPLQDLPCDAFALVVSYCPDLESLTNLGSASHPLGRMVFRQNLLNCDRCRIPLFADENLSSRTPHTRAFSCSVCRSTLCGYQLFDYDRRNCKPQKCDGCGSIECRACMEAHTSDEHADGYGTENYCKACQGEFEFGMGGC